MFVFFFFFFSSRRRHTRFDCDWSSDVCSSDLAGGDLSEPAAREGRGAPHRCRRLAGGRQSAVAQGQEGLRPAPQRRVTMFIGHYALGLAAKRIAPRTSLGTLFLAPSLADLLWPVFLLLGWERVRVTDRKSTR